MGKFKAPENFGGITHRGETYKAMRKGGAITLPDDFPLEVAIAHGLVPHSDGTADEPVAEADSAAGGAGDSNGA